MANVTAADLALVDSDFRAARRPLAPPTRFYFNLTERCQIRCAHCITRAPALTESGQARTLGPDVIEALRPHLSHATYAGFAHAGEPLIAPGLEPLLGALQRARGGEPTVIHVLTNGMALTHARFDALAQLGVTSWSVSIDGMSASTNDALRVGSRIEVLKARIPEWCQRKGPARLGISWTVSRSNAGELEELVSFARSAGVDWIKLEEMFPINPLAEQEARVDDLTGAVARAMALGDALGIPVLDHTRSVQVWCCEPSPSDAATVRFSRLDDFANRMAINPCRFPYETICIEPNGDCKPVSFHHASGGNLLTTDLVEIWRSHAFARERTAVRQRRLCGAGPATCAADAGPAAW
jgi:cyclomaltodextrinase